jgi:hypothetical protein
MRNVFRRAALALAIPAMGAGLMVGLGGTAFAGGNQPPKPPPPVVKVFPATPVYNYVSCEDLLGAQKAEIATLSYDAAVVWNQIVHTAPGWGRTELQWDFNGLEAQIKAIHPVTCQVIGYRCPDHAQLTVVETRTGPHTYTKTEVCVLDEHQPPKV